MNPVFKNVYLTTIVFYGKGEPFQEEARVVADSLVGAIDKAGEYAQAVCVNEGYQLFDVTNANLIETVFIGIEDETIEEQLLPETGILTGELPEGWNKR